MRQRKVKEIKKIDFVLATLAMMFLSCGAYNEYYYKEIVDKEFDQNLMIALMAITALLALFLLMRSNVCRNKNTALGAGLFPAIICMLIAYSTEYKFQMISTVCLVVLSTLRAAISLGKIENISSLAKLAIMVRYVMLLTSTLGLVALMFVAW